MKSHIEQLQKLLPLAKQDVPLAPFTTLKVGGAADLFFEARTTEQYVHAIRSAQKLEIPITILGGGSNVLIGDRGIRGLVIKNLSHGMVVRGYKGKYENGLPTGSVYVEVDAGVIFNSFVRFTVEEGYKGIEMHLGLPGTVGGAIYMNSKWTNPEGCIGDVLYHAVILNAQGELVTVPKSYFRFGYDYSILQDTKEIVVSATFLFDRASKEELWEIANRSIAYRRTSQPQGIFTPGCTFRNISQVQALTIPTPNHTTSAGFLIDCAGLKGYTIGNAQVSTVHANFIENRGGALASDFLRLIEHIQQEVLRKFGVTLEEEIVRLGEF